MTAAPLLAQPDASAAAARADDDSPCGLLALGRDGTIVEVNRTFLAWTGYTQEALLGVKRFADLLTVPGKIFYSTQFAPLLQMQGTVLEVAFELKCFDGSTLPILANASACSGNDGNAARTRVAVFNVTQGRRHERDLLQACKNAEQLAAVVASSGDAVFSISAQGLINSWNAGAEVMFGRDAAAALGQTVETAVRLVDSEPMVEAMRRVGQGEPVHAIEVEVDHPAGGCRSVSMAVSAIRNALERVVGLSVIARDITDRREAEQLRINEAAARQATLVAEAASRAKSEFLANMSHEIRTPLNGVIGMLQLLAGTPLDDGQRRFASVADASAKALLTLINDILDFSKIEAGKLELENLPFDLVEVAEQAVGILSVKATQKGLATHFDLQPGVARPRIGPADRIRQVLVNLLGNAVKFTEHGSVTLRIQADDADADALLFEVIDTGIGIPPDRLDRLFKSFSQVDASTTRQYGGTGLGLAISKQLAGLMGGTVGVRSEVGVGSTFWFKAKLPCDNNAMAAVSAPVQVAAPVAGLVSRHLLVAEDNEINQMVVGEMLRRLGYTADMVDNGRAAVEAVATKEYGLILMDCQMPEMDGFAATTAIRAAEAARPAGRRVPVIALTANAIKGDRESCLTAGMDDYLTKPLDARELAATLTRWLAATAPVAA